MAPTSIIGNKKYTSWSLRPWLAEEHVETVISQAFTE